MKKTLTLLVLGLVTSAFAQGSPTPTVKVMPFLSGYNVWLQTNATQTYVGVGTPQVWYTTSQGQIVQSLTNNYVNGGYLSSNSFPDAFVTVPVSADANGDYNANASLVASFGNTNWIPIAVTNSIGQYFVTNWPLAQVQYPNWMYPATTNNYLASTFGGAANTNTVTVQLFKVYSKGPNGQSGGSLGQNTNWIVDSSASYTVTFGPGGATPTVVSSNLPASLLQGCIALQAKVSCVTNPAAGASPGILLNQLLFVQPQP